MRYKENITTDGLEYMPERWQVILLRLEPDLANHSILPEEDDLIFFLHDTRGMEADDAIFLAGYLERWAKAQEFLEKNSVAPRKWRSKIGKKSF